MSKHDDRLRLEGRQKFAAELLDKVQRGEDIDFEYESGIANINDLGLDDDQIRKFLLKSEGKRDHAKAQHDRRVEQQRRDTPRDSGVTTALGLGKASDRAEDKFLKQEEIDTMEVGGFAKRDIVRQKIRRKAQQVRRERRATNMAYRQRIKFGDTKGALEIIKEAREDGVVFGGIGHAGDVEEEIIGELGKEARAKRKGEGTLPEQKKKKEEENPVAALLQPTGQGSTTPEGYFSTNIDSPDERLALMLSQRKRHRFFF